MSKAIIRPQLLFLIVDSSSNDMSALAIQDLIERLWIASLRSQRRGLKNKTDCVSGQFCFYYILWASDRSSKIFLDKATSYFCSSRTFRTVKAKIMKTTKYKIIFGLILSLFNFQNFVFLFAGWSLKTKLIALNLAHEWFT